MNFVPASAPATLATAIRRLNLSGSPGCPCTTQSRWLASWVATVDRGEGGAQPNRSGQG